MNVGIDIVSVQRVRRMMARFPGAEHRLFTERERAYCRAAPDPVQSFAGTIAAKEAVIKAVGLGPLAAWAGRIEITRDRAGRPTATVVGRGASLPVSISHDGGIAVATAASARARDHDTLGPWQERV